MTRAEAVGIRVACAMLVVLAFVLPMASLPSLPFRCLFATMLGHPCVTCGMTRAWVLEAHGAWRDGIVQSPFGAALFFAAIAIAIFGPPRRVPRSAAVIGTALLFINWVYIWTRST